MTFVLNGNNVNTNINMDNYIEITFYTYSKKKIPNSMPYKYIAYTL